MKMKSFAVCLLVARGDLLDFNFPLRAINATCLRHNDRFETEAKKNVFVDSFDDNVRSNIRSVSTRVSRVHRH